MGPELFEVFAQALDTRGVHGIQPSSSDGFVGHQVRPLEYAEVLGDRRAADGKLASQFAHRDRTIEEPLEDRAARRVTQGRQLCVHRGCR